MYGIWNGMTLDADREELVRKLEGVNYTYSPKRNQFI